QSLRARQSERSVADGRSKTYLSGMLFLWQDIKEHKQSLRARQSERSVADGRSKTYLSGMLFLWQDIK
ncbi:hypothetical protein CPA58_29775, partial [Klebsiella pneumoniae]